MLKSIAEDIRQQFSYGNRITRLIIINAAVFVAINLVQLGFTISTGFDYNARFDDVVRFFALNGDLMYTVTHPWVIVTHLFLHVGFWHFLFNMLFLYWFGRIVGDMLGDQRIIPLYLMSGLFGALVFLISAPLIGAHGVPAYGASASVMGFVLASGLLAPEYNMRLLLIGDVKLKYIVLVVLLLDLFGIGGQSNTGGHLAHLGGAAFGAIYISMLRRGTDLAIPVNRFFRILGGLFSVRKSAPPRPMTRVFVRHKSTLSGRNTADEKPSAREYQDRLDAILEKIKEKGYENLTSEEKDFLAEASKK